MARTHHALRRIGCDDAAFLAALAHAGLPTDDLGNAGRYYTLDEDREPVGFGGLEGSGPDQMIRSVVIPPHQRGRGCGRAIVECLVRQAVTDGVERLWLLTASADPFFARLGFQVMPRAAAPHSVRDSRQFSGLCPASAVLMCQRLR